MKTTSTRAEVSLKRRIRQFYQWMNGGEFGRCFQMIDPRLLDKPGAVTLLQYVNSLREFTTAVGPVGIREVQIVRLHLDGPNRLYENRDFAIGKSIGVDRQGDLHEFFERWVREGSRWFTRSTGLVLPARLVISTAPASVPDLIRHSGRVVPRKKKT